MCSASVSTFRVSDQALPGDTLVLVIYRFDEVDERVELLPMAARRALDHAGLRLSREGWASLPLDARRRLVAAGSEREVDVPAVGRECQGARPPAEPTEVLADPPSAVVPDALAASLGPSRPLTAPVWSALSVLDRFALVKAASRGRPERLASVYDEVVGQTAAST